MILISNDDGVNAPGIIYLSDLMKDVGKVVVVAPSHEMSASSHAVTLKKPLFVEKVSSDMYSVSGTPADCILVDLLHILKKSPDYILSGINLGQNLGEDVFYSGTVAAAREGALYGIKSAAFSIVVDNRDETVHFESAALIARDIVKKILGALPQGVLLNVNIPNLPFDEIKGIRITKLSTRRYVDVVKEEGGVIVLGGKPIWKMEEGTDIVAVKEGYVSITPLLKDLTDYDGKRTLEKLAGEID